MTKYLQGKQTKFNSPEALCCWLCACADTRKYKPKRRPHVPVVCYLKRKTLTLSFICSRVSRRWKLIGKHFISNSVWTLRRENNSIKCWNDASTCSHFPLKCFRWTALGALYLQSFEFISIRPNVRPLSTQKQITQAKFWALVRRTSAIPRF